MAQRKPNQNGDFPAVFGRIAENVEQVIQGKGPQIRLALTCLLADRIRDLCHSSPVC